MKRKRGNKKGKSKKLPLTDRNEAASNIVNPITEDNSGLDDYDKDESESEMEAETPSSTGTDQQEKIESINSGGLDKAPGRLVYGRVKVKIKTSKMLESQLTSSDAPTQSDTDKSSQQVGLEKQLVSEKMEDSANSLPETSLGVSANQSKKASIKIKSSRGFSSTSLSPCNNADKDVSLERSANEQKRAGDSVREYSPFSNNKASGQVQDEKTHQKDLSRRGPHQNKQELNAALEVIKKVMKMDAAEPFNVPVNPIALGIPDYFDVIDTPMDFGTVCSNIENGDKYMNAEDVLKDVQYIWGNCYKYNNKGDYILELMKRVKKNFAKCWTAAGLSNEQMQGSNGVENIQSKDAPSSQGKMPVKGGHLKHKTRKRQGVKRHKDECLCAICVMMRRRQEREESAQIDEDHNEPSDGRLAQEGKPEGASPVESPCGEGTSSSMDNSLDQDADADMEDKGDDVKMEDTEQLYSPVLEKQAEDGTDNVIALQTKGDGEISEHSQLGERTEDDHIEYHTQTADLGGDTQNDSRTEEISMQHVDEAPVVEHQKPKESLDKIQKAKICENLRRFENPMLLELCGTLFSDNRKSLWTGPHSLVHRQGSTRSSPIHAAVATFLK